MSFWNRDKQEDQVIEYEQSAPQMAPAPYYQPNIMPSEKADLYDKIRPEDVIDQMKFLLMGFNYDLKRGEWVQNPALSNISLSEVGATQIATLLYSVSNKSTTISKLTDDEIRTRTKFLVRTAMKNCLEQWESYGIKTPATMFFVKEIILSIAFIVLKQPENAGVRVFIGNTSSESKIIQENGKKEGTLSAMFRR